jgi:hypothetical protein
MTTYTKGFLLGAKKLMREGSFIVPWVNQHPRWYHGKKSQNSLKMFFYPWSLAIYSP